MALAIGLGAFGAHLLEKPLAEWYTEPVVQERMRQIWETAVKYQGMQAAGIIMFGLWLERRPQSTTSLTPAILFLGSLIFSGSLYVLVISGQRWLGAIVPIGGALMMLGWGAWAWMAWREPRNEKHT